MPKKKAPPAPVVTDGPPLPPPSKEQTRAALRKFVENFYDYQERRLQTAGRTHKRPAGADIQLHEIDLVRLERASKDLERLEKDALGDVQTALKRVAFYNETLSNKVRFRGIGPTMAGVILSSFDIAREDTVSKMWSFAGLRPLDARRCKLCNSVVEEQGHGMYVHKGKGDCARQKDAVDTGGTYASGQAMRPVRGEKLKYNKWLRTKLCGVLGPVLLQCKSPWAKFYYDYKHRKESAGWGRNDGHRHAAAIRYMIKMLLLDIWTSWRQHEGLSVRPPYQEQYLGHRHGSNGTTAAAPPVVREDGSDVDGAAVAEELAMLDL